MHIPCQAHKAVHVIGYLCIPKPGKNPMHTKATVAAFDMAAVIHMVKPGSKTHTFKDYAH